MRKITKVLMVLLMSVSLLSISAQAAQQDEAQKHQEEATTRHDAVIFKVHDIVPVSQDGIVTGCDFTVTLYNRTAFNFRNFTLNLKWNDAVEEKFHFDSYVKTILGDKAVKDEETLLGEVTPNKPLETALNVNAFGANKQLSLKSHISNEKCYLLLKQASYVVTPCDIARSTSEGGRGSSGSDGKDCTGLFQLVDTSNPEYFGEFKPISATEIAVQNQQIQNQELSDIDVVIAKIVENLGVSGKTLTNIN